MNMNRYYAIAWALMLGWMLCTTVTSAQSLSLDSCQLMALRNNAAVVNANIDVNAAEEVKKQLFTKYFPSVNAIAGGYHSLNPLIEYGIGDIDNAELRQQLYNLLFEYGAVYGLPNAISMCHNGLSVGITAVQPVFMGGQIVNGNRLADVGVQAAKLQAQLSEKQLQQMVEENYWLVVSLHEKKKTLLQALTFLDTLYRDVTVAQNAGIVTHNDQLKVTLKQHEMQSDLLKVNNGIVLATMALCQTVGIEYSDKVTLTDTVPFVAEIVSQDSHIAVNQRVETKLLDLQVNAEQLKKKITVGEKLPHLMVGASASYGNLIFDKYNANGMVFAMLQVPITDWWETSHKIKQQNYWIQKAENQRADLMEKMLLETQQAWNNLEESYAQMRLMELTVQDATANLQTVQVNYEAGLVPVSELLEAQTLLRQAQDQWIDARMDCCKKNSYYQMLVMP